MVNSATVDRQGVLEEEKDLALEIAKLGSDRNHLLNKQLEIIKKLLPLFPELRNLIKGWQLKIGYLAEIDEIMEKIESVSKMSIITEADEVRIIRNRWRLLEDSFHTTLAGTMIRNPGVFKEIFYKIKAEFFELNDLIQKELDLLGKIQKLKNKLMEDFRSEGVL